MSGTLSIGNETIFTHSDSTGMAYGSGIPAGSIVQIQQSVKTDATETRSGVTASGFVDITGTDQNGSGTVFCVKITPKFSTSKILVSPSINLGGDGTTNFSYLKLFRDSTGIFIGDSSTDRVSGSAMTFDHASNSGTLDMISFQFLDSPTIPSTPVEITYKVKYAVGLGTDNSGYATINASHRDGEYTHADLRGASSITVMEISQ